MLKAHADTDSGKRTAMSPVLMNPDFMTQPFFLMQGGQIQSLVISCLFAS
jgi:hypothetical protein